jgi:hypothetical protein
MEKQQPLIRQAVFIVDDERSYKADVNHDSTIKNLKRIVIAAANLCKATLQIYYQGEDFTDYDDLKLKEISNDQEVVFHVKFIQLRPEDSMLRIKLQLGDYCQIHDAKYLYFYCYTCKKSLCSICMHESEHTPHDLIEKYDYLQSTKHLVDLKFRDLNSLFGGLNLNKKNEIEGLRNKVRKNYFPILVDMLSKIENKMNDIIDIYSENYEDSVNKAKKNLEKVKEYCTEGLDKLKEEIEMEKMMVKEEIFLTFDKKYRELELEKSRLVTDVRRIENNSEIFNSISSAADKVYNEIKNCMESILNSTIYSKNKIVIVEPVSKDEIYTKILSNLPEKKSRSSFINRSILDNSIVTKVDHEKEKENRPDGRLIEISPIRPFNDAKSRSSQREIIKSVQVLKVIPNTRDIAVYDDFSSEATTKTIKIPLLAGIDRFLENCSTVNYNDKIYVSGGLVNGASSNSFICYDHPRNSFIRMADLITPRHSHSMYYWNDNIFVVGGNTTAVERYEIKTQKWIKLSNFIHEDLFKPILYVHNSFLYSFFGQKKDNYVDFIQRLNLKNAKSKWEIVPYKNPEKIDLKFIGAGIIPDADSILMFGGKGRDGFRADGLKFDFLNNTFSKHHASLENVAYFAESQLIEIDKGLYGHFDNENNDHFLRLLNN